MPPPVSVCLPGLRRRAESDNGSPSRPALPPGPPRRPLAGRVERRVKRARGTPASQNRLARLAVARAGGPWPAGSSDGSNGPGGAIGGGANSSPVNVSCARCGATLPLRRQGPGRPRKYCGAYHPHPRPLRTSCSCGGRLEALADRRRCRPCFNAYMREWSRRRAAARPPRKGTCPSCKRSGVRLRLGQPLRHPACSRAWHNQRRAELKAGAKTLEARSA
jgi:hypothetical protein